MKFINCKTKCQGGDEKVTLPLVDFGQSTIYKKRDTLGEEEKDAGAGFAWKSKGRRKQ